ncbi:MAG TPA: hypothetical protein VEN29_14915 [Casimicrobiaceae bacterium]|nr:hypothetical protein [Casimicrobiaceae bacterium]
MNMNTKSHHLGTMLGVAGVAVLSAMLWQVDPNPSTSMPAQAVSPLLSDGTLGRMVVEFIAAGFALGVLGVGVKLFAARFGERRRAASQRTAVTVPAPTVAFEPAAADATASEFDDVKQPGFAPIVSLTEAQVRRQRIERDRERKRATLNSA